jgi:ABC-type hemin transport system substrate-binding protein
MSGLPPSIGEELRAELEKPAKKKGVGPLQRMIGLLLSVVLIWAVFRLGGGGDGPAFLLPDAPAPRVASTSPAITETLLELGLGAHVVGRSGYCRGLPADVPVIGDLRSFDAERLALAKPEVLFVQPPLAGVDPALREFCARRSITLAEQRIDSLAEISQLLQRIEQVFAEVDGGGGADGDGGGGGSRLGEEARARIREARAFLDGGDGLPVQVAPGADGLPVPVDAARVLVVVSVDPVLAVGRGNYLHELLVRAGCDNAVEAEGWVELSAEAVVALRPTRIVAIGETPVGALEVQGFLEVLPWAGAHPPIAAGALPEMLIPSLRMVAKRGEFARLLRGEGAGVP